MRLIKTITHKAINNPNGSTFYRRSARGIILHGTNILLIYTKRYNDYSFPGGGVDTDEELVPGLQRELSEEIGASHTEILQQFGYITEFRPSNKPEYDLIHMDSFFYVCNVDYDFQHANPEDYEVKNGSYPLWVNIDEAISHNLSVLQKQEPFMGFSIERETFVLQLIRKELL